MDNLTPDRLRSLFWRMSTIDERTEVVAASGPARTHNSQISRIDAWREMASPSNSTLFDDRLSNSNLEILAGALVAQEASPDTYFDCPGWTDDLAWILEALKREPVNESIDGLVNDCEPLPYEEVFVELSRQAWRRVGSSQQRASFSAQAANCFQRILLNRLTTVCARPLYEHFHLMRLFHDGGTGGSGSDCYGGAPRHFYHSFITELRSTELDIFFSQRPVVLRLIASITRDWISMTAEFLSRYSADYTRIVHTFNENVDVGRIAKVESGLSDPHNGGRVVLRVTFENGLEIAYKPKCLAIDIACVEFLQWLELNGAPPSLTIPTVICGDGYGWAKWKEPRACTTAEDASRFFVKAGATLCILMVLGATDFHGENIIADLDGPIGLDLETFFHPWQPDLDIGIAENSAIFLAAQILRSSVISTHYLPSWILRPDNTLVRSGGLGEAAGDEVQTVTFDFINTDFMQPVTRRSPAKAAANLPALDGKPCKVAAYKGDIKRGFSDMYRFFTSNKGSIGSCDGPLSIFKGLKVRALNRETKLYFMLIERSLRGDSFSDGFRWSLHFERLTRLHGETAVGPHHWRVMHAERQSLSRLDIPYFYTYTDSRCLVLPSGETLEDYYPTSSMERQLKRVGDLSSDDLDRQNAFIDWTCEEATFDRGPIKLERVTEHSNTAPLTRQRATELCLDIASTLSAEAVQGTEEVAWIGSVPIIGAKGEGQLEVVGQGLYAGSAGIGLFLSALSASTGREDIRNFALRSLRSSFGDLPRPWNSIELGAGSGLGSKLYALSLGAKLLNSQEMLDSAKTLVKSVSDQLIANDSRYDLLLGAAGAIIGLHALYKLSPEPLVLERAIACGRHLVRSQQAVPSGGAAWKTIGGHFMTGMSHGASGIAMALGRLQQVAGEWEFSRAIELALEYERHAWYDKQKDDTRKASAADVSSWCHGWSGIGMARLDLLEGQYEKGVEEIERAISAVLSARDISTDDICCGNFGKIDFLLAAGQRLGRPDLVNNAAEICERIVNQREISKDFIWRTGTKSQNPSLFTGSAGVGYNLLRLTDPNSLPSILMWE